MNQLLFNLKDKKIRFLLYPIIILLGAYAIGSILGCTWYIVERIFTYLK